MFSVADIVLPVCGMSRVRFVKLAKRGFQKSAPPPMLEWLEKFVRFPQTWESKAFDLGKMPQVRGFIERFWLDPTKRKANLPWSVRSGKTTTLLACMCYVAENDPAPMGILFPDRGYLEKGLMEHIYPMLEATRPLARQLLKGHKRNKKSIVLRDCRVRLANAGTLSDASGWPARYIFKFEHDKCPVSRQREADASRRIESRTRGYSRDVKIVEEGSPGKISEGSRAARMLASETVQQVRFQVPCPHCGEHQQLRFKQLRIPREAIDSYNAAMAFRESEYHCESCDAVIEDHHRVAMMQAGKWVIAGEYVDANGNICGTPDVDSDTMVFGEYNALYSLFVESFGTIAKEFIEARDAERGGDSDAIMNFYMEVLAVPWDDKPKQVEVSQLAKHLEGPHRRKELPPETAFLTTTSDIGLVEQQLTFHWQVMAWWKGAQGAVIDWGDAYGVDEFLKIMNETKYPLMGADGIEIPIADFPIALDSGKYSDDVYGVVSMLPRGIAIKGDSKREIGVEWTSAGYRAAGLPARFVALKKRAGASDLVMIASEKTQQWRVSVVNCRKWAGYRGHIVLPVDICGDHAEENAYYFDQLQADHKVDGKWLRTGPNEAGDNCRYGRAIAERHTRNGTMWDTIALPVKYRNPVIPQPTEPPENRSAASSDSRFRQQSYLISNRGRR